MSGLQDLVIGTVLKYSSLICQLHVQLIDIIIQGGGGGLFRAATRHNTSCSNSK